jgi:hypothetical protein
MPATVHKLNSVPINVEAHEIASLIGKADSAAGKAHNMRVEAGMRLLILRQRVEKEEKADWWSWVKSSGCFDGISKRDMQKLLALAAAEDPEAAAKVERANNREAKRRQRARAQVVQLHENQPVTASDVSHPADEGVLYVRSADATCRPVRRVHTVPDIVKKALGLVREMTERQRATFLALLKTEYRL